MTASERLEQAVAQIADGSTVAIGGYFQHRHPMAAVRELVRQEKRDLHIVTPLGGVDTDMVLAAGLARHLSFGFISMDVFGQSHAFRAAVESGSVTITEYGDLALIRAFEAADRGLPWMPVRAWGGSDIAAHHPGTQIADDDGQGPLMRVPALRPDWTLVHVPFATPDGGLVRSGEGYDALMVQAAERVIATTESLISREELAERFSGRVISRYRSDEVIELPFGAHPSSCFPFYVQDVPHLLEYVESAERDFGRYRGDRIGADEQAYLESLGVTALNALRERMTLARRAAHHHR